MPRWSADHVPAYRHHKASGQAIVTIAASLVAGLAATLWQASVARRERARAEARAADVYRQLGDGGRTLESMRSAQAIYEPLAAQHPNEPTLQRDVMVIHSGLAVVLMNCGLPGDALHANGRFAEAIAAQTESLAIDESLLQANPENRFIRNEAANVSRSLALMHLYAGRIDRAVEHAENATGGHAELARAGASAQLSLGNSRRVLDEALLARRDLSTAIAQLRAAGEAYAVPSGPPAPPAVERRELAYILADLGEAQRRADDPAAPATLVWARDLAEAVLQAGQGDHAIACWRIDVRLSQAQWLGSHGDPQGASTLLAAAVDAARELLTIDQASFPFRLRLARAVDLTAESAEARHAAAAAVRAAYTEALEQWPELARRAPDFAAAPTTIGRIQPRLVPAP